MQLTIDIKDSAFDKVMYLLDNLKSDVKIIDQVKNPLDVEAISKEDNDYKIITKARKDRKKNPNNYQDIENINWE